MRMGLCVWTRETLLGWLVGGVRATSAYNGCGVVWSPLEILSAIISSCSFICLTSSFACCISSLTYFNSSFTCLNSSAVWVYTLPSSFVTCSRIYSRSLIVYCQIIFNCSVVYSRIILIYSLVCSRITLSCLVDCSCRHLSSSTFLNSSAAYILTAWTSCWSYQIISSYSPIIYVITHWLPINTSQSLSSIFFYSPIR
jgi:hypothetical protein